MLHPCYVGGIYVVLQSNLKLESVESRMLSPTNECMDFLVNSLGAVSTLVAAFLGAWFAFGLEARRRRKQSKKADVIGLNQAAFAFIRAHNSLLNIKSQIISGYENAEARHHFIKPVLTSSIQRIKIDY